MSARGTTTSTRTPRSQPRMSANGKPLGRPPGAKSAAKPASSATPVVAKAAEPGADSVASWRKKVDAVQQAAIAEHAKAHGVSVAAYRQQVDANLKLRLNGAQIYTRRSVSGLAGILKSGEFQTFRETGRTAGADTGRRNKAEASMFGKGDSPIYAYMSKDVGKNERAVGFAYGPVAIRLKSDAVGGRTTVSFVDSLNAMGMGARNYVAPSPLSAPTTRSWSFGMHGDPLTTNPTYDYYRHAEAQIHGGVRTSDIAEVIFQRGSKPSPAVASALQAQGIPYSIERGPKEKLYSSFTGPQHLPMKAS